jgi:hypothetical protein
MNLVEFYGASASWLLSTPFMKKVYFSLLVNLVACMVGPGNELLAMKKERTVPFTIETLARDKWFIKLNNAINRFDPEYLRLVYNDARTNEQLTECATQLFGNLKTCPLNIEWQAQIAAFYHFSSVHQLKEHAALILNSIEKLAARYGFQKSFLLNGGVKPARKLYAKNKLYGYPTLVKRRPGMAWRDFVADYFRDFDYTYYMYKNEPDQNIRINLRATSCLCAFVARKNTLEPRRHQGAKIHKENLK